jgi:hypothetical protein
MSKARNLMPNFTVKVPEVISMTYEHRHGAIAPTRPVVTLLLDYISVTLA